MAIITVTSDYPYVQKVPKNRCQNPKVGEAYQYDYHYDTAYPHDDPGLESLDEMLSTLGGLPIYLKPGEHFLLVEEKMAYLQKNLDRANIRMDIRDRNNYVLMVFCLFMLPIIIWLFSELNIFYFIWVSFIIAGVGAYATAKWNERIESMQRKTKGFLALNKDAELVFLPIDLIVRSFNKVE